MPHLNILHVLPVRVFVCASGACSREDTAMSILLGSHVKIGTKKGTVRFIGETEFASGTWYGVELEMAVGKNNGSVNGKSYFVCDDQKGLFVKKSQIRLDRSATKATGSKASSSSHSNTPKSTPRHATTASHDHKTTHQTALTSQKKPPSTKTSAANTPVNPPRNLPPRSLGSPDKDFQIGDTVKVGTKRGTIRFVGETKFAAGAWYGVELEHPVGKNNGSINGEVYFECKPSYGLFVKKPQLRRVPARGTSAGTVKTGTPPLPSKPLPPKEAVSGPSTPASVLSTASDNTPDASPLILPSPLPPALPSGPPTLLPPKISTQTNEDIKLDTKKTSSPKLLLSREDDTEKQVTLDAKPPSSLGTPKGPAKQSIPQPSKATPPSIKNEDSVVPKARYDEMNVLLEETIKRVEELEGLQDNLKQSMQEKEQKIETLESKLANAGEVKHELKRQEKDKKSFEDKINSLQDKLQKLEEEKRSVEVTVRKKDKDISQLKDLIRAEAQKTEIKMKDLEKQLFEAKSKHSEISSLHNKNSSVSIYVKNSQNLHRKL